MRQRFHDLRERINDPQSQISDELFDVFMPAAVFIDTAGPKNSEFCELGATFFVSIEKLEIMFRILDIPFDRSALCITGIEYSPFLKRVAKFAHPEDRINFVTTPQEWQRARDYVFHVSRFVGSYAFRSTEAFTNEIARCDAFNIIDAFNLGEDDFHSWDLGLPITFMSLPIMVDQLIDSGFDLFLMKATAEFHAAAKKKAMVVQLFGINRDVDSRIRYFEKFETLGGFTSIFSARPLKKGEGIVVLEEIGQSLSSEQWDAFAEYKKFFPIWGGPPGFTKEEVRNFTSSHDLGIDLCFDDKQAAELVRQSLKSNSWDPR
jgi:hypothetical protein